MKLSRKIFTLMLGMLFFFALTACTTTTTATTAPAATTTTTTAPVTEPDPIDSITTGVFAYSFYAEGYGSYTSYIHFYPEDPVLGAVYYLGGMNNGSNSAGLYTVEKVDHDYSASATREEATASPAVKHTGTADYTVTFFDFDGNELDSCAYDGDILYQDMEHASFALYGANHVFYYHITDPAASDNAETFAGEVGISYLSFVDPEDETKTLVLNHNLTYVDLIGDIIVEGSWTMEANDDDGYDYTLEPNESFDTGAVLSVSEDELTATYTPDGGTALNLENADQPTEEPTILMSFVGTTGTLDLYPDGTYAFKYVAAGLVETGTWEWKSYSFKLTQDNDNVITATMVGEAHVLTLSYVAVASSSLTSTFTAEGSVYGPALGAGGTYVIPTDEPVILFSFTSSGSRTLDIYDDGTYIYTFATYGLVETGTWAWQSWSFTLTQSNSTVLTATMDGTSHALNLHYVAEANAALTDDFTVESSVWGAALGNTGNYTPAE